jgi:hypothetical protein
MQRRCNIGRARNVHGFQCFRGRIVSWDATEQLPRDESLRQSVMAGTAASDSGHRKE